MSYKSTKLAFFARLEAMLPTALKESNILPEITELYPDLHVPYGADLVCAADSHAQIIDSVNQLTDADVISIMTLPMSDAIMQLDTLSQSDADEIMTLVRRIDPAESNIAAEIRDTIRDNFDNVTI